MLAIAAGRVPRPRPEPVRLNVSDQPAAPDGHHAGVNRPVRATTPDGRQVVFKHNSRSSLGAVAKLIPESHAHRQDILEVVGSHLMTDYFHLPGVTYREAYMQQPDGRLQLGICSDFVHGLQTLEHQPAAAVRNPDQAVAQSIVKGWMGDWDTIVNDSNIWMNASGQTMAADYGNAFTSKVTLLGVPKANEKVMRAFAHAGNVEPVVRKICGLQDGDIYKMVDEVGSKWVGDWDADRAEKLSSILIANRDQLRRHNPFAHYYQGHHPELSARMRHLMWVPVHAVPFLGVVGHVLDVVSRQVNDILVCKPQGAEEERP